jgi:tetratricopeptide (TPR) repeat protein
MRCELIGFCAIAVLLSGHALAEKKCELQRYGELPVTMKGTRPLIAGTINGSPAMFLADSGAFFSTLFRESVERHQLKVGVSPVKVRGVGGVADAGLTKVKDFSLTGFLGGDTLKNVDFIVLGNSATALDADGIIGQNIIGHADTEYDLANGYIRLFHAKNCSGASLAYWATGDTKVAEMKVEEVTPLAPHLIGSAKLNGKRVRIMFDTGAWRSILRLDAAARAGVKPEDEGVDAAGIGRGIGKRTTETWLARFDSLDLGGEVIKNARLRIGELRIADDADMLLGADFFLSHRIYVASKQKKIYFTYNGGPVFDLRASYTDKSAPPPPAGTDDSSVANTSLASGASMDAASLRRRGAASAGRQDFASAIADFDQAIKLDPSDPENYYQRALARRQNREPLLALADLDQTLKLKPDHVAALMDRGTMRLARRDENGARDDFDATIRYSPSDTSLLLTIAQIYAGTGGYDEAIRRLDAWIAANPKDDRVPTALNDRCWSRALANKELDLALTDCNAALKNGPRNSVHYDSRAMVYLRRGELDKSIADYKTSLKLQPKNPRALYGLGLAELKKGMKAEADRDMQAAAAINPNIANLYRRWGLAP